MEEFMSFKKIASYLKNNLVSILLVIFIVVMFFVGFYDLKYKMAESGSFIKKIYLVYSVLLAFLLFIYLFLQIITSANILFRVINQKISSSLNHIADIGKVERDVWIILYLKNYDT